MKPFLPRISPVARFLAASILNFWLFFDLMVVRLRREDYYFACVAAIYMVCQPVAYGVLWYIMNLWAAKTWRKKCDYDLPLVLEFQGLFDEIRSFFLTFSLIFMDFHGFSWRFQSIPLDVTLLSPLKALEGSRPCCSACSCCSPDGCCRRYASSSCSLWPIWRQWRSGAASCASQPLWRGAAGAKSAFKGLRRRPMKGYMAMKGDDLSLAKRPQASGSNSFLFFKGARAFRGPRGW